MILFLNMCRRKGIRFIRMMISIICRLFCERTSTRVVVRVWVDLNPQPAPVLTASVADIPDLDECQLFPSICKEPAQCVNIPGMFECRCPTGFHYNFTSRTCGGKISTPLFWFKMSGLHLLFFFMLFQTWMSARWVCATGSVSTRWAAMSATVMAARACACQRTVATARGSPCVWIYSTTNTPRCCTWGSSFRAFLPCSYAIDCQRTQSKKSTADAKNESSAADLFHFFPRVRPLGLQQSSTSARSTLRELCCTPSPPSTRGSCWGWETVALKSSSTTSTP